MNQSSHTKYQPQRWFNVFKYTLYGCLSLNVLLFLLDEWEAASHLFADGLILAEVVEAFAATLDTAAWVVLLLMFELETCVLPDEKIKGKLKFTLHGLRVLCYLAIVYAFYGYAAKTFSLYDFDVTAATDLCALAAAHSLSFMSNLDTFVALDAGNCQSLMSGSELLMLPDSNVVTDNAALLSALKLAWTDVINAGAWLLIVFILELDVQLQLRGLLKGAILTVSKAVKAVLYLILLLAAIYWGIAGPILDFWDALLWIVAFVFIEMNMFQWQEETSQAAAQSPS